MCFNVCVFVDFGQWRQTVQASCPYDFILAPKYAYIHMYISIYLKTFEEQIKYNESHELTGFRDAVEPFRMSTNLFTGQPVKLRN